MAKKEVGTPSVNKKALELLLSNSVEKFKKPQKEVEIKRLSEALGEPFMVTIQTVSMDLMKEMEESRLGNVDSAMKILEKGLIDPPVRNKEVQAKFGAPNYVDLINRLFVPGEIIKLSVEIADLSGINEDITKDAKN